MQEAMTYKQCLTLSGYKPQKLTGKGYLGKKLMGYDGIRDTQTPPNGASKLYIKFCQTSPEILSHLFWS